MFSKKTVKDIDVRGKKVLVRVDFNVPLGKGLEVTDDTRIKLSLPTLDYLINNNAKIILMSHFGRPKGIPDPQFKLDPAAKKLEELTGKKIKKFDETFSLEIKDYIEKEMKNGDIILLENLRFNPGEKANDEDFSRALSSLADIYVNDAFGAAHRFHASTAGVAKYIPAVAGLLMKKEIETLDSLLESPLKPFLTILGGSKISDKLQVIGNLIKKVDSLIVGGGMSYTFLKAQGHEIGSSICEDDQLDNAKDILELAKKNNVNMLLPVDIVLTQEFDENSEIKLAPVGSIPLDWMGMDMGPKTIEIFKREILNALTIFWNGPIGVFEWDRFSEGTREIAMAIAESNAVTIAGGGDTLAALKKYGITDRFSHISSGGGASMKFLEGEGLPGVSSLLDK